MSRVATELKTALGEAGHRLTGPRLAVWDVVASSRSHLTAEEIAESVRDRDPTVNLSSVYRSLSLFAELGLVRESNLGANEASHWELAHSDESFHLRCTSCGKVEHHTGDLVTQVEHHLSHHHGFHASRVELLVHGTCAECAATS
ncbi:MAG: Fur family transcriptional regulator [Acidimicrobiia bacterium]|nr:Fur family transcriptional regulator [Acidimicrobiia bacterium]